MNDEDEDSKQAVYNVDVDISVVLGQSNLRVNQLLNEVLIARGEVVITSGDKIGVTLTELVKSIYNKAE